MKKISDIILKHKIIVLSLFIILTIISIFLNKGVKINYSLSDYLPKDSSSLVALEEMGKSYPSVVPNVKLLIPDITIDEALSYKEKLITVDGVNDVLWADNYFNLIDPNFDANNIKDWYKNSDALFQISIDTANTSKVLNKIKKVIPTNSLLAGNAVDIGEAQNNMIHEVNTIMLYVVPIILIILLLTTSSWFEPILFLITIGISIIINMGTNIIFGEISSVTKTTAAILQLAVSMDYAIFLLHRFAGLRRKGQNVVEAMGKAMAASTPVILASALTTILGFLALVLMKFKIGPDLGLVLAPRFSYLYI
jgi:predicted RND superfamily exporter protein